MSDRGLNEIDGHVATRLRAARNLAQLTQEQAGALIDVSFQQMQKYEKGINRIGASRLHQIADILQVPVSFLFEGGPTSNTSVECLGEAPSPAYVSDFLATSEGLALTRAFTKITDAKLRRSIVDLVEQIAGTQNPS